MNTKLIHHLTGVCCVLGVIQPAIAGEWLALNPIASQTQFSGGDNRYYFPLELKEPINCQGHMTNRFYLGLSTGTSGLNRTLGINQLVNAINFALQIRVPEQEVGWKIIDFYGKAYYGCSAELTRINVDYNSGSLQELNQLPENTYVIDDVETLFADRSGYYQIAYLTEPMLCDGVETKEVVFFPASYASATFDEGFYDNSGVWANFNMPLIFNAASTKQLIRINPLNARIRDDDPNLRHFCEVNHFSVLPYLFKPLIPIEECEAPTTDETIPTSDDQGSSAGGGTGTGGTDGGDNSGTDNTNTTDGSDNSSTDDTSSTDGSDNTTTTEGSDENTTTDGSDNADDTATTDDREPPVPTEPLDIYLLEPEDTINSQQDAHVPDNVNPPRPVPPVPCCRDQSNQDSTSWIRQDLGKARDVHKVLISLSLAPKELIDFELAISEDGENWQTMVNAVQIADTGSGFAEFAFTPAFHGQYVKYIYKGSNQRKGLARVNLIKVYGR